ncbi:MAG: YciI family protein [Georgfuchsia sp.]
MLYVLMGEDVPDSLELRQKGRPAHLARIEALQAQGRLVLAGPFPAIDSPNPGPAGFLGSMIVADFGSQAEAETWFKADPYVELGVFQQTSIRLFKQVYPK